MPIPDVTSVEFDELDILDTQVTAVTAALADAQVAVEATTTAMISSTLTPDTALTGECRDIILAAIQAEDYRAPVLAALNNLITALNVLNTAYDVPAFPAAT